VKKLTISQIAALAGVSTATVSRVLNGKEDVNDKTRLKVQRIIAEHGYRPSALARGLSLKKTDNLGLIIPDTAEYLFTSPYFSELIRGISRAANAKGFRLLLATAHTKETQEGTYRDLIGIVDGLILLDICMGDERISYLRQWEVPFVLVGRLPGCDDLDWVDSDNLGGAKRATTFLLKQGHRQIAFLNGPPDQTVSFYREQGYRQAYEALGLHLDESLICNKDFSIEAGVQLTRELLARGRSFSAVFAASDLLAFGAIQALKEAGFAIGEDISIVGFDDLPLARHCDPALTTVHQPIYEIGEAAANTLISRISGGTSPDPLQKVFRTELIVRKSSPPISRNPHR